MREFDALAWFYDRYWGPGFHNAAPATLLGRTCITTFRFDRGWHRQDVEVAHRCYAPDDLSRWLREAGFGDIIVSPAASAGMTGDIAVGRVFFSARRGRS